MDFLAAVIALSEFRKEIVSILQCIALGAEQTDASRLHLAVEAAPWRLLAIA